MYLDEERQCGVKFHLTKKKKETKDNAETNTRNHRCCDLPPEREQVQSYFPCASSFNSFTQQLLLVYLCYFHFLVHTKRRFPISHPFFYPMPSEMLRDITKSLQLHKLLFESYLHCYSFTCCCFYMASNSSTLCFVFPCLICFRVLYLSRPSFWFCM